MRPVRHKPIVQMNWPPLQLTLTLLNCLTVNYLMISLQMGLIAEITNPLWREGYFNSWAVSCLLPSPMWASAVGQLVTLSLSDKEKSIVPGLCFRGEKRNHHKRLAETQLGLRWCQPLKYISSQKHKHIPLCLWTAKQRRKWRGGGGGWRVPSLSPAVRTCGEWMGFLRRKWPGCGSSVPTRSCVTVLHAFTKPWPLHLHHEGDGISCTGLLWGLDNTQGLGKEWTS